jgi:hypothetical protein
MSLSRVIPDTEVPTVYIFIRATLTFSSFTCFNGMVIPA